MRAWQALLTAVLAAGLCTPGAASSGDPDTPGLGAPVAVTGRPALQPTEVARFVAINQLAEPRRQAAAEHLFEKHLQPGDTPLGPALMLVWTGMETRAREINAQACRERGLDCREYAAIARRILQVNELVWLDLREEALSSRRQQLWIARATEPRTRALETWRALRQVETWRDDAEADGLEADLDELERSLHASLLAEERAIQAEARLLERLRSSARMRQARLDRASVLERLPELVYLGKPLVRPPLDLPAGVSGS